MNADGNLIMAGYYTAGGIKQCLMLEMKPDFTIKREMKWWAMSATANQYINDMDKHYTHDYFYGCGQIVNAGLGEYATWFGVDPSAYPTFKFFRRMGSALDANSRFNAVKCSVDPMTSQILYIVMQNSGYNHNNVVNSQRNNNGPWSAYDSLSMIGIRTTDGRIKYHNNFYGF